MTISIGKNLSALRAQRSLSSAGDKLSKVFERLSSGSRINRASDDAAGLSIADNLRTRGRIFNRGVRNTSDGISLLNIADAALESLSTINTRLLELAEQAANGSFSYAQRFVLNKEAQALSAEYKRIIQSTEFNGIKLFDGTLQGLRIQAGIGIDGSIFSSLGGKKGTQTFSTGSVYTAGGGFVYAMDSGDINGDGNADVVTMNATSNLASVSLGNGDGTFGSPTTYAVGGTSHLTIGLADVTGDGQLDMVSVGNGTASVWKGNGNGTFQAAASYSLGAAGGSSFSVKDVNGDGMQDIVAATTTGYSMLLGTGNGTMQAATTFAAAASNDSTLADLNGDGIMDIAAVSAANVNIFLGNGNGTFQAALNYAAGGSPTKICVGDVDNNGTLDIVTGYTSGFSVLKGNGNGTFQAATTYSNVGTSTLGMELADLDGNGSLDIVTATFNGYANAYFNNGSGGFGPRVALGGSGTYDIELNDMNNDGIADVMWTNVNLNNFEIIMTQTEDGIQPLLSFSLLSQADALQSIADLRRKLDQTNAQRGVIGAFQARLMSAGNSLTGMSEQFNAAESRIRDVDIASESAELTRLTILQQAGAAIMAQANLQPQLVLQLLKPPA